MEIAANSSGLAGRSGMVSDLKKMGLLAPFGETEAKVYFQVRFDPAPAAPGDARPQLAGRPSRLADATPAGAPFPKTHPICTPPDRRGNMVTDVAFLPICNK